MKFVKYKTLTGIKHAVIPEDMRWSDDVGPILASFALTDEQEKLSLADLIAHFEKIDPPRNEISAPGTSAIHHLLPGEPFFLLRAQDLLAPILLRIWADLARIHGASADKVGGAREIANQMEDWPDRKWPD